MPFTTDQHNYYMFVKCHCIHYTNIFTVIFVFLSFFLSFPVIRNYFWLTMIDCLVTMVILYLYFCLKCVWQYDELKIVTGVTAGKRGVIACLDGLNFVTPFISCYYDFASPLSTHAR